MNRKVLIVIIFIVGFLIVGIASGAFNSIIVCFKEGYSQGYNTSFLVRFRESFVKSCRGSDQSETKEALCDCFAKEAIEQLTIEQLKDDKFAIEYIKAKVVPRCMQGVSATTGSDSSTPK